MCRKSGRQDPENYIKDNPKSGSYIQAMPRERLERTVVLNEVREIDRQNRMREGIMTRIKHQS